MKDAFGKYYLACLESSPSRIVGKRVCSLSFWLFLKLLGFKNAILFKILKKKTHFAPFSAAYYFLIDFSKILKFTFPYSQPSLLSILSNCEYELEYIRQNWWSNFHTISILLPKSKKKKKKEIIIIIKNQKKYHNLLRKKRLDLQLSRIFASQWVSINGGNLK